MWDLEKHAPRHPLGWSLGFSAIVMMLGAVLSAPAPDTGLKIVTVIPTVTVIAVTPVKAQDRIHQEIIYTKHWRERVYRPMFHYR